MSQAPIQGPLPRPPIQAPRLGDLVFLTLGILAIQYGAAVFISLFLGLVGGDRTLLILLMVLVQSLLSIGAIHILVLQRRNLRFENVGLRPFPPEWRWPTAVVSLLAFGLVFLIQGIMIRFAEEGFENPQIEALTFDTPTPFALVLSFLVICVVVPVFEELAFRGLLFGWLRLRLGTWAAAGLSAFAFAVVHGMPFAIPGIFVLGVVLALLYERSGSLWPAIFCHGAYNAMMLTLLYAHGIAGLDPSA